MLIKGDSIEIKEFIKSEIKNPLKYKPIPFDYSEWDNIPSIITKQCINLDKYMHSTINTINK
jgi:hypothetical protein